MQEVSGEWYQKCNKGAWKISSLQYLYAKVPVYEAPKTLAGISYGNNEVAYHRSHVKKDVYIELEKWLQMKCLC